MSANGYDAQFKGAGERVQPNGGGGGMLFGYSGNVTAVLGDIGGSVETGELGSNKGTYNFLTTGKPKSGFGLSANYNTLFVFHNSKFKINDFGGYSNGFDIGMGVVNIGVFTNKSTYVELSIGIGPSFGINKLKGISGDQLQTNTSINKIDHNTLKLEINTWFKNTQF